MLSVEKTEINEEKIFVFEGRKPDKSFIEGKIEAEDIFIAHDMLTKEYNYSISKLYPSTITSKEEQEKVFQELLCTFDEKKTVLVKKSSNTSDRALEKNKAIIEKLKTILSNNNIANKEEILSDLKRLDLINNNSTIKKSLKEITKDLATKYRAKKDIFTSLKPIVSELGVFLPPDSYFSLLEKLQAIFSFLDPIFHPTESYQEKHAQVHDQKNNKTKHDEFKTIQKNPHINVLLQKKYGNQGLIHSLTVGSSQSYFYTLYRRKSLFLLSKISITLLAKILRMTVLVLVLCILLTILLGMNTTIFVSSSILLIFGLIIALTLVIPAETV